MKTEQLTDYVLKAKAFDLLAFVDPAIKHGIMVLFQFSHMFSSYINVTTKDEHLFLHKGDIEQESLGASATFWKYNNRKQNKTFFEKKNQLMVLVN